MAQINDFCEELQAQILLRLPTKADVVRLQVVCKRWYSLISSPHFIARFIHLHHYRDVESNLVFQINYDCDRTCNSDDCRKLHYEFKTISNNSSLLCDDVYGFRLDYLPCSPTDLILRGSFDDLILCSCVTNPKKFDYYVINLFTRQWIALPPPPAHPGGLMVIGFLCVPPTCSEYKPLNSSSHHKLMVVKLFTPDFPTPLSTFKVQIFSSEDGQWRTLVVSSPLPMRDSVLGSCPLVAYRGMLHWLNNDYIAVYDPLNTPETFSPIIHLPIPRPRWKGPCFKLCVCQGHLRLMETASEDREPVVDVWELEDYDSGLWNLVHKVYLNNLIYGINVKSSQGRFSVLTLHPENRDVVYMRKDNGIALVNMKTRVVERYCLVRRNAVIDKAAFHLIEKWWPTPVSSLLH